MGVNQDSCLGKVSLQDLSQGEGEEISSERLEEFLSEIVDLSSEKHDVRPDALVKIIYEGELIVLTQEQADLLLNDPMYGGDSLNELRNAVNRALKGDVVFLRQELMVLIMMARMTLDQFKKDKSINQVEIARQYPLLERTEKESNQIMDEIVEMSNRIERLRSQHPIIADYETKVGQMVALQQSADLVGAKKIAFELHSKQKHYLFCCRTLEPDVKGIQFRRMDLQKIKKRLLNIHKYLLAQKVGGLQFEVDAIKKKIRAVSSGQETASQETSGASTDETQDNLQKLEEMMQRLEERQDQLESVQTQRNVYEKDESKTDAVITEISTNVLKVPQPADISDKVTELEQKRKRQNTQEADVRPKYARMAILQRRRKMS